MTIYGLADAIKIAIDRASRTNEGICIVAIGKNQYVLWREKTIDSLILAYTHYKVVKTIRIKT